jgi:hypothetical protein
MSASETTGHRICPICGSANSRLSLFCAECGSSLNGGSYRPDSSDDSQSDINSTQPLSTIRPESPPEALSPWAPNAPDDQATTTYQPVSSSASGSASSSASGSIPSWQLSGPTGNAPVTETTSESPAIAPIWSAASSPDGENVMEYDQPEESLRGFFFGIVAIILVLAIAAIYAWTILPDGSLRDTIQGWIDGIA